MVLLEADHAVETIDFEDPFGWVPPPGLTPGFFGHPQTWPVPVLYVVAKNATAASAAEGDPAAIRGVVDAISRLDGRCDLIVGECGFFARAWDALSHRPSTPTVLSGLDFLDDALRSTSRDVAALFFGRDAGERFLAERPGRERVRAIGISPAGDWPLIGRPDWATAPAWTLQGIRNGFREVLEEESQPRGRLDGVGAIVIECTVLPQFRHMIREFSSVPVYDAATSAIGLLS
jgi:hypothetical protein